MAKKTDQKILDLIKLAKQKKETIQKAEKPRWKTNCSFSFDYKPALERYNLQVHKDIPTLVSILGFLLEKSNSFELAKQKLNVESEFRWQGFTLSDWQEDIQTTITRIQIQKEKDELENIETRLNKLISPELRAELELQEIEGLLK